MLQPKLHAQEVWCAICTSSSSSIATRCRSSQMITVQLVIFRMCVLWLARCKELSQSDCKFLHFPVYHFGWWYKYYRCWNSWRRVINLANIVVKPINRSVFCSESSGNATWKLQINKIWLFSKSPSQIFLQSAWGSRQVFAPIAPTLKLPLCLVIYTSNLSWHYMACFMMKHQQHSHSFLHFEWSILYVHDN